MLSFGIKLALWDSAISGVYHSFRANSYITFRKRRKAGKRFVQLRSFIRIPKKHFSSLKLPLFFPPLFQTIMDKSLRSLLHFWGVFQLTQVQPLPSPHKQCRTRVSRIFFRVSTLYRVGGGRTARKFRKHCTVLRGNREITEKYEYCSTVPRTFVHDCSNEIQAGAKRENQYGRITFPPKKKRIYCYSLEYCSPITVPF